MDASEYTQILGDFRLVKELALRSSEQLVGTAMVTEAHRYADPIYTKLICHAMSLDRLLPQLGSSGPVQLWDIPSTYAVSRCVIEAYETLEYIALASIDDDAMSFRLLVWKLHDLQRRTKLLSWNESTDPRYKELCARLQSLHAAASVHSFLTRQPELRKKLKDAPQFLMPREELHASIGINHRQWLGATTFLSQHIHTLPMSVDQLQALDASAPDSMNLMSLSARHCLGYLARAVIRMAEVFPAARVELSDRESTILEAWNSIVVDGVSMADVS